MKYFWMYIKQTLRFVLKPLSFVPAIVMMCVIFMFSEQDGNTSGQLSYEVGVKVFTAVNEVMDKGWSEQRISELSKKSQFYIRKTAHFTEYFMLGASVAFPLYVYGIRGIWLILLAGGFCIGFATLDEYHQSFTVGRSPQKRDVIIDSCGVMVGVVLTRMVCWFGRMTIFRPLANKKTEY